MPLRFLDVFDPFGVVGDRVYAQPDDLAVALVEFRLEAGHIAQLGGTHRSKILGMRKQNGPTVSDPLVKVERSLCGLRRKIGRFLANM